MAIHVLSYLERSAERFPEKTAVTDEFGCVTYDALLRDSRRMGTALARRIRPGQAVGVYMEKSAQTLEVFFGAVYAGGFYSSLNPELPPQRLGQIVSVLAPGVIVTSAGLEAAAREAFPGYPIVTAGALAEESEDSALLSEIRRGAVDTDPLYVNFTSGSTGTPKGIVVAHRSVLDLSLIHI